MDCISGLPTPSGSWLGLASSEHCRGVDRGRREVYLFAQFSLDEVAVGCNSFFFFFFLMMRTIFKVFIECVTVLLLLYVLVLGL